MVVEPAGAAALAAVVADPAAFEPPVVVVLSGGNVDPLLLLRVIRHGLAAAGRYASLRLKIADRPGSLARLLHELAEADANVVEVEHARIDPRLSRRRGRGLRAGRDARSRSPGRAARPAGPQRLPPRDA